MNDSGGNMQLPFASRDVPEAGFFRRLFNAGALDMGEQALANLFCSQPLESVTPEQVKATLAKHGLRGSRGRRARVALVKHAIERFLADDKVSEDEGRYLAGLQTALALSSQDRAEAADATILKRYRRAVEAAVGDGRIDRSEQAALAKLATGMQIGEHERKQSDLTVIIPLVQAQLDLIKKDERVSPKEEAGLRAMQAALGVDLEINDADLERYKRLWQLQYGPAPSYSVDINLQRREECRLVVGGEWAEYRTRTVRIRHSGWSSSIRIAKGVRYRFGSTSIQRISRTELTTLDRGQLFATTRRLIFRGSEINKTIGLGSVVSIQVFADAIVIEKANGRPVTVFMNTDMEVAGIVLQRLVDEA